MTRASAARRILPDVFMVAFDEPNAEENWRHLQKLSPDAKLVSGVRGIEAAYRACAREAATPYFFLVDADNYVLDETVFASPHRPIPRQVMVWRARNPVNGLAYGHGGIKLYPAQLLRETGSARGIDISTSIGSRTRSIPEVASEHRFNTTPYRTWSAAFRETVKLACQAIAGGPDSVARAMLDVWCGTGADAPLGSYCLEGARAGRDYGTADHGNPTALALINDGDWLRQRFSAAFGAAAEV